jgi:hypothetical protein
MKKYIVFGHDKFYPNGGMNDMIGSVDTKEELRELTKQNQFDRYDVVDRDTWQRVQLVFDEEKEGTTKTTYH